MTRYALPLIAISALSAPAAAAEIQIATTGPVVELTISESVAADPDVADISAGVTTQAQSAVEAMRANSTAMRAVIDKIKALGIAERDIQTTGVNLSAQYDYDQEARRQVFNGYSASNRVSVKLRDIAKVGEVLDALVAAGATDLGGPSWSIADPKQAQAQARRNAVQTAQAQALEYARMAGYAKVRLLEINETTGAQPPMPFVRAQSMDAAKMSAPVQPGVVEAQVTITVKYEMTN